MIRLLNTAPLVFLFMNILAGACAHAAGPVWHDFDFVVSSPLTRRRLAMAFMDRFPVIASART